MKKIETILNKLEHDLYMNAPYGYLSITPDGIIKKVNSLILNIVGYSTEEMLGKSVNNFLFQEQTQTENLSYQVYGGLYSLLSKNNTVTNVTVEVVNLKKSKYQDIVLSIIPRDNRESQRSLSEKKLQHTKPLRQSEHKTSYTSSSVSHEIQTPLSIIKGTLDLLDDTSLTDQQKEYLEILKNSSEVLRNVMMDVIDFSSLNSNTVLKEEEINIRDFINGIFKMHSIIALKKNLDLKLILDERMTEVIQGDKTKLAQVLLNLLSNAVKFTRKGIVTLEVQQEEISNTKVTLLFKVSDTGIGIKKDEIKNIFDEFSQANHGIQKEYGGLGLGLSICKNILALYGSKISVTSSSAGSEFSFLLTLPIGKQIKKTDIDFKNDKLRAVTILIADDNETNALITSHYLKKLGMQYEIAQDGDVAYQKVLEGRFDLVLMDIQMPVASGINATRKIRSIENVTIKKIPIVAFSADDVLTKTQLNEIGINDFLLKPFNIEDLLQIITVNLSEFKQNSKPQNCDDPPSVNLETLQKMTGGNPEELSVLIKKSIEEFEESKIAFAKGCQTHDVTKIKAVAHKLKSQIHYLKAFKLQSVINESLEIIKNPTTSENNWNTILNSIVTELDKSIDLMKTF